MTLLLDFLFSKEVRGRWGENSSCLGFDARRRSRDNPWATPSILHTENEKQTLSFSLRLLVCVSFGIVGRLVVTEDPANPNQVYKAQPRDPPPPSSIFPTTSASSICPDTFAAQLFDCRLQKCALCQSQLYLSQKSLSSYVLAVQNSPPWLG